MAPTTSCWLGTVKQHTAHKIKVCELFPAWDREVVRPPLQVVGVRLMERGKRGKRAWWLSLRTDRNRVVVTLTVF